jgi:flagellar biosynthesis/type III secretory pathway M-ring protein FliF/YscJ
MKKVELTHAEVIKQYESEEVIKEFKSEKGTIVNFSVKVKINDRVEKSPCIYEKCVYFADTEDKLTQIRKIIRAGNIVDIKGSQDRSSYDDKKTGKKVYSDSVRIREITPVTVAASAPATDDDLPF